MLRPERSIAKNQRAQILTSAEICGSVPPAPELR